MKFDILNMEITKLIVLYINNTLMKTLNKFVDNLYKANLFPSLQMQNIFTN